MALWCYLPLTTAKAEDEQCLVKFTDRMEKWRSRGGTCGQDPPQSPWPSGMTLPVLLFCSLSPRRNNAPPALGPVVSPSLFFSLTSVLSRRTTAVGPPATSSQLIFSSEDKRSLDLDRNQRGGQTAGAWRKGRGTKRSFSVETAGKSLTLRSSERRRASSDGDRVELKYKCLQISVARKQMTC